MYSMFCSVIMSLNKNGMMPFPPPISKDRVIWDFPKVNQYPSYSPLDGIYGEKVYLSHWYLLLCFLHKLKQEIIIIGYLAPKKIKKSIHKLKCSAKLFMTTNLT